MQIGISIMAVLPTARVYVSPRWECPVQSFSPFCSLYRVGAFNCLVLLCAAAPIPTFSLPVFVQPNNLSIIVFFPLSGRTREYGRLAVEMMT